MASAASLVAAALIVAAVAGLYAPPLASATGHNTPEACSGHIYFARETPERSPGTMHGMSQAEFLARYEAGWYWEPSWDGRDNACAIEAIVKKEMQDSTYFQRSSGDLETVNLLIWPVDYYTYLITGEYGVAGREGESRPITGSARESQVWEHWIEGGGSQRVNGYYIMIGLNAEYDLLINLGIWPYTTFVYALDDPKCAWDRSSGDPPPDGGYAGSYCWYAQSVRLQYLIGVPNDMINCPEGRDVLMQAPSGRPACVYERSADKLEDRGFVRLGSPPSPS